MLPNRLYDAVRKVESLFRFLTWRRQWAAGVSEERRIRIQRLSSGQETGEAGLDGLAPGLELHKIVRVGNGTECAVRNAFIAFSAACCA